MANQVGGPLPVRCFNQGLAAFEAGQQNDWVSWVQGHGVSRTYMAAAGLGFAAQAVKEVAMVILQLAQCARHSFRNCDDSIGELTQAYHKTLENIVRGLISVSGVIHPQIARLSQQRFGQAAVA